MRKATATQLAELGGSEYEVAAMLGHQDTKTTAIYTAKANQNRLRRQATQRLADANLSHFSSDLPQRDKISLQRIENKGERKVVPEVGLEPTTQRLTVR